jgi:protein TonB
MLTMMGSLHIPVLRLGMRPDLNTRQRALVWGLVLAMHGAAALWLWRAASVSSPVRAPMTIAVVALSEEAHVPPQPRPAPASHGMAVRTPSVLAAPKLTETSVATPTPVVAMASPSPVVAPAPSPAAVYESSNTQVNAQPSTLASGPTPLVAQAPKTLPPSAVRYLNPPVLSYPRVSRELGESGLVRLRVLVDEQGRPREIEVTKSSNHPRLDQAAVQAMRAARFQPHIEDGQPRMVWVQAPLNFQLDEL